MSEDDFVQLEIMLTMGISNSTFSVVIYKSKWVFCITYSLIRCLHYVTKPLMIHIQLFMSCARVTYILLIFVAKPLKTLLNVAQRRLNSLTLCEELFGKFFSFFFFFFWHKAGIMNNFIILITNMWIFYKRKNVSFNFSECVIVLHSLCVSSLTFSKTHTFIFRDQASMHCIKTILSLQFIIKPCQ